jgi:hypothetical protein
MSWGYKILIVYLLFVAGIVFLVVKSSTQNQDLVTENYYEQELRYQDKIEETERANALSSPVKYYVNDGLLNIIFPEEMTNKTLNADILVYCTADKRKDLIENIKTQNRHVRFKIPSQNKGLHAIKVTWKADGITYYNEHKMIIQ